VRCINHFVCDGSMNIFSAKLNSHSYLFNEKINFKKSHKDLVEATIPLKSRNKFFSTCFYELIHVTLIMLINKIGMWYRRILIFHFDSSMDTIAINNTNNAQHRWYTTTDEKNSTDQSAGFVPSSIGWVNDVTPTRIRHSDLRR